MIHAIEEYFPYLLIGFFLIRSVKEPLYLLGIPFLLFFRYCIFFQNVKIFNVPGSFRNEVLLFIWLFIFWIIFSTKFFIIRSDDTRVKFNRKKGINLIDFLVLVLAIISVIDFVSVINQFPNPKDIIQEFISLISIFIGYFIIKDFVSYSSPLLLKNFLYSIVIVNTIAAFFYFVHQGLHIELYGNENYSEDLVNGEIVTRNMWVMPTLSFFSISYLLVFRKERPLINIGMLFLNFFALFFTFFRSFVLIGFAIILIYFFLIAIKKKHYLSFLKYLLYIGAGGLLFVFLLKKVSPGSATFFLNRIQKLQKDPTNEKNNDLIFRFRLTSEVVRKIPANKKILGLGPVTKAQLPFLVQDMYRASEDMAWPAVIFRWGFLGFLLYVLIYLIAAFKSFSLFTKYEGILSDWGILIFLVVISQILESFIIWTFMSPDRYAMSLWYISILSFLLSLNKSSQIINE